MMNADTSSTSNYEPLAEGIEDLQVAVGVDTNNDGVISEDGTTADEWMYNASGDAALSGTVHAVRITLIARSVQQDIGAVSAYKRPAAEDHAAASTNDKYRRRVLRSMVELRNIKGSP